MRAHLTFFVLLMQSIKCNVVGSLGVGKFYLLTAFTTGALPSLYPTSVFDHFTANVMLDNALVSLNMWETKKHYQGQSERDERNRSLSYPGTDVFLLCYSTDSRSSLDQIKEQWYREISGHCPGIPFLLIGTKSDTQDELYIERLIENNQTLESVSFTEGQHLADTLGAHMHMVCSALNQEGIKEIFDEAVRVVLSRRKHSKPRRNPLLSLFSSKKQ